METSKMSPAMLAEITELTRANISDIWKSQHGKDDPYHVWCYDRTEDNTGPRKLHSGDCNSRTLIAHIHAIEAERDAFREALEELYRSADMGTVLFARHKFDVTLE
jgi:hypothetical protein